MSECRDAPLGSPPRRGPSAQLRASSRFRRKLFAARKPVATLRPAALFGTARNCPLDRARSRRSQSWWPTPRDTPCVSQRGLPGPAQGGLNHLPARARSGVGHAPV